METPNNLCQYLEWDSEFFGLKIARVIVNRFDADTMNEALEWCKSERIECLYFLADTESNETIRLAEDNHFRFVDMRVTFDKPLIPTFEFEPDGDSITVINLCNLDDIGALRSLSKISYRQSRYYFDPGFPVNLADAMYETWIEKSCLDPASAVFVIFAEGTPAGYIACRQIDETEGRIDLIAVDPRFKQMGLGQKLVKRSSRWFAERNLERIRVITQGRNIAAQRLYQRNGFLISDIKLWYHRWFIPV